MPAPEPTNSTALRQAERRRQIRGLLLLAFAVILIGLFHADRHVIFPPGWWRLW
jgi:hypothetical protein